MKPKHLNPPFDWKESPFYTICDRIFYAFGEKGETFRFPDWSSPEMFGNELPRKIEFCSGNGHWIAEQAKSDESVNWIALEKRFVRVRKIWSKLKNFALKNLFVVCGEALDVTKQFFPDNSFQEVYVNFPDPWPKKRHAKYRLVQPEFVNEVHRILLSEGKLILATDDEPYCRQMIEVITAHPGFEPVFSSPHYITEWEGYGTSYFESLWREKGKGIYYLSFHKKGGKHDL